MQAVVARPFAVVAPPSSASALRFASTILAAVALPCLAAVESSSPAVG